MPREVLNIDDAGWWLWRDIAASWKDDRLFLPQEVDLGSMPINIPTGGWETLDSQKEGEAVAVTLPATVEQHFWGADGLKTFTHDEYYFASQHPTRDDGIYRGVSWWWRDIDVPATFRGQRVDLEIPAARLRAEVFVNRRLVACDVVGETPFAADVTDAIHPGTRNRIAIRITNPGGRMDWIDYNQKTNPLATGPFLNVPPMRWGEYEIPMSHGFGGLDCGIRLVARPPVRLDGVAIRNKAQVVDATALIALVNDSDTRQTVSISACVTTNPGAKELWARRSQIAVAPGRHEIVWPFSCPDAVPWSLGNPALHDFRVEVTSPEGTDRDQVRFGFRWFEVVGLGHRARLRLNGRRIRLIGAISWNYWAPSGLFPQPGQLEREADAARELGLNTLTCHRNIGNARAFDVSDEQGLLRIEEPGAGREAWAGTAFGQAYMKEKIRRMVVRDRNHPSLVAYCLQNEQVPEDPREPGPRAVMEMVRDLDPSRLILLKSGFGGAEGDYPPRWEAYANKQAFYLPGDGTYHCDDGSGWSGWLDRHTVGGPGIYQDWMYEGPDRISHGSANADEIVIWGETLGSGCPDALDAIAEAYAADENLRGYNEHAHKQLTAAYESAIDRLDMRATYPTAGKLAQAVGDRSYEFWGRIVENARICDAVDGILISGWESTTLDNHTGIVDPFRNHKANPAIIRLHAAPLHLAVKSRGRVFGIGDAVTFDVFLVNETGLRGRGRLAVRHVAPDGKATDLAGIDVEVAGGETFGQLLAEGLRLPAARGAGHHRLSATLTTAAGSISGEEAFFVAATDVQAPRGIHYIDVGGHALGELFRHRQPDDLRSARSIVIGDTLGERGVISDAVIDAVHGGAHLIYLADGSAPADAALTELATWGALRHRGMVGPALTSWYGSWYFSKPHRFLDGLPSGRALGWEYQADPRGSNGIWMDVDSMSRFADGGLIEADGLETVIAYGRDHHTEIGAALFTLPLRKGRVSVSTIAGLYPSLSGRNCGFAAPVAKHLLSNLLLGSADRPLRN